MRPLREPNGPGKGAPNRTHVPEREYNVEYELKREIWHHDMAAHKTSLDVADLDNSMVRWYNEVRTYRWRAGFVFAFGLVLCAVSVVIWMTIGTPRWSVGPLTVGFIAIGSATIFVSEMNTYKRKLDRGREQMRGLNLQRQYHENCQILLKGHIMRGTSPISPPNREYPMKYVFLP